jgi:hypothetical protein
MRDCGFSFHDTGASEVVCCLGGFRLLHGSADLFQDKVFHRLHRSAQLFEIELNVALRDIARSVIQQPLRCVVAQTIAEPAYDRGEGPAQVVRRERNAAFGYDIHNLSTRISNSFTGDRVCEDPITIGCVTPLAHETP